MGYKNSPVGSDPSEGKSHPVGKALGGTAGVVAGTAAGAAAGPIGAIAGGLIGAIAGWLEGKTIAEGINPNQELAYWRDAFVDRDYYDENLDFDRDYLPAYTTGVYGFTGDGADFMPIESSLRNNWDSIKGESRLSKDAAVKASRDSFDRAKDNRRTH